MTFYSIPHLLRGPAPPPSHCTLYRQLEQTLRALLNKYEQEQRRTLNLSKIAALFKQLEQEEAVERYGDKQGFPTVLNGPLHGGPSLDISDNSGARGGGSGGKVPDKSDPRCSETMYSGK